MTNHEAVLRGGQHTDLSYEELRTAIDHGGLALHYQPIVDLVTGGLAGFEALVRLPHPVLGLVPAAIFVPLAERWGLIHALDEWVLWAACEQLAAWQSDVLVTSDFHLAINVSGCEVDGAALAGRVERAIDATGVDPAGLVVELTETQQFERDASVRSVDALHALGVRVALDDLGSDYGTFARLRSLNFDIVKIDRGITSLVSTKLGAGLIRTIVKECTRRGATVVAEGVETAEQAEVVRNLGCDLGQGYLWDPALPVVEAERMLSAHPDVSGQGPFGSSSTSRILASNVVSVNGFSTR